MFGVTILKWIKKYFYLYYRSLFVYAFFTKSLKYIMIDKS